MAEKLYIIRANQTDLVNLSVALRGLIDKDTPHIILPTKDDFGIDIIDTDSKIIYHIDGDGAWIETAAVNA